PKLNFKRWPRGASGNILAPWVSSQVRSRRSAGWPGRGLHARSRGECIRSSGASAERRAATSMKITYDHQIFSVQRYGGVSRYFAEIAGRLARRTECAVQVMAFAHVNEYLSALPAGSVLGFRVPQIPRTDRLRQRADDAASCIALRLASPDRVHETYY